MKKLLLLLLFTLISVVSFSQNTVSGTGYVLSHTIDCPTITDPQVIRFGNGTTGRVELCLTTNNLKATCGGGNNKNDQVFLYEDKNNDGVLELFVIWIPTTTNGTCIITEATNGYIWARFCGDGGCDAGDMVGSTITVSWQTFTTPSNNTLGNALTVNICGSSFVANNIRATSSENCNGYVGNTGPPDNLTVAFENNLDCNNTTSNGINPGSGENGGDVGYSVENDMWYKFCPGTLGTWVISLTKQVCYTPTSPQPTSVYGYQYTLFQGTTSNLGPLVSGGTSGQNNTGTTTINVNVTSTTNCYYMQIDGYGGTGCVFGFTLTAPAGSCVILSVDYKDFTVINVNKVNVLTWSTINEINNERFEIQRSVNGDDWVLIGVIQPNKDFKYDYFDSEYKSGVNYYRLKQVDNNGDYTYSNIISINNDIISKRIIKQYNFYGVEVDDEYKGFIINYYDDGTYNKTIKP